MAQPANPTITDEQIAALIDEFTRTHPGEVQLGAFLRFLTRTRAGLADLARQRLAGPVDVRAKLAVLPFGTARDLAMDDAAHARAAGQSLGDLPVPLRMLMLILSDVPDHGEAPRAPRFEGGEPPPVSAAARARPADPTTPPPRTPPPAFDI